MENMSRLRARQKKEPRFESNVGGDFIQIKSWKRVQKEFENFRNDLIIQVDETSLKHYSNPTGPSTVSSGAV